LGDHWQVWGSASVSTEAIALIGSSDNKILKFSGVNAGLVSDSSFSVIPENITPVDGYYYTLSAEVYLTVGNKVTADLGGANSVSKEMAEPNVWQTVSLTAKPGDNISSLDFSITVDNGTFYLRNIKLEANNYFSGWSKYGATTIQEKLIPDYLTNLCYITPFASLNDYRLKPGAPAICDNFARRCSKDEVGCQNFTSSDGFSLTGKVNFDEYCPQECVNYDSYVQKKTNFQSISANYFIPRSATACSASAAGCSRFTNLDSVAQGGEANEYYSSLRRCVQPDNTCGAFYSWNGEDESGYQLKAFSLVKDGNAPKLVGGSDSTECSEAIFKLTPASPDYNPDCRQFYDKDGNVSYHLYSRTISCSTECRRVRLDETTTATECAANEGTFASSTCIFQALPNQSTSCTEAESGCREYNGNNGNNVRIVSSYDFENGATVFSGVVGTSTASTNKNGLSIQLAGSASVVVGNLVRQNAAYSLKFLAKAGSQTTGLQVYFEDASGNKKTYFDSGKEGYVTTSIDDTEWRVYQISLPALNHRVESGEKLVIARTGGVNNVNHVFLDSMVLTEITDRYYLIKDSWVTPDICYYDLNDDYRGAEYNLGCSAYQDPNGTNHNLRQFSGLCDSSSAGCEAMVDTQNSKNPFSQSFASNTLNVAGDKMIYAIFSNNKQCSVTDIGCSRLGRGEKTGTNVFFSDVYVKNNPDNYDQTICQSSEVGCETFYGASGGKSFFRNPFGDACQYRASQVLGNETWGWFKIPVKRCDTNKDTKINGTEIGSAICASDSNCSAGVPCIIDSNDYPCETSYFKTIGNDSSGAPQPSKNAGLCEAAASGCSEYIDSTSEISPNLVVNPTFADLDKNGSVGDLWPVPVNSVPTQNVFLSARKLYVARSVGNNTNTLTCDNFGAFPVINTLGTDNKISLTATSSVPLKGDGAYFVLKYDSVCHLTNKGANHATSIEVREAVVEYQNEFNLDTKTCGSKVNFDDGCVLFNNRAYNAAGGEVSSLNYNAFTSPSTGGVADTCTSGSTSCNANTVVKVTPNRVCSRWLACTTKIKNEKTGQDYCYGLGECDKLSDSGDCANFVSTPSTAHNFAYANDKNATGYQLLNSYYVANMQEVGNRVVSMSPIDFEATHGSLDFKVSFGKNGTTLGTSKLPGSATPDYKWIDEPSSKSGKTFAVSYPAQGKKFIGIQANTMVGLKEITISSKTDYFINYLANTDALTPGSMAMVRVLDGRSKAVLAEFTDRTNGWERIVHKINVDSGLVIIVFGVKQGNGVSGEVYYDDIKLEPVLKINNTGNDRKDYLAKECRLYPSEDSLTCTSRNENVIKNGWEGYCLKHDPINPGVCLQWLPLDNIASASVSEKNLGYKGTYPLYYCSEANANFDLVEKRIPTSGLQDISSGFCDWTNSSISGIHEGPSYAGKTCATGYKIFYYEYYVDGDVTGCMGESICIPEADNIEVIARVHDSAADVQDGGSRDVWINMSNYEGKKRGDKLNAGYTYDQVFTYPASPVTETKKKISSEDSTVSGYSFSGDCCGHTYVRFIVKSSGWYRFDGFHESESSNANPSVRVLDYNEPPQSETDLKLLNTSDQEKLFTPTCNMFIKVVDEYGNGMPWVERLQNEEYQTTSTPAFFPIIGDNYGQSNYKLAGKDFGLLSIAAPYGAAILNGADVLGKAAIKFATMFFNKNSGEGSNPLAGRPYGCSDLVDGKNTGSCKYFGYCEKAPEVTCLTVNSNGGVGDCGGKGACISYGYQSESLPYANRNAAQKNTLKNIFLEGLAGFTFSTSSNRYASDGRYIYNAKPTALDVLGIEQCSSVRPAANSNFGVSNTQDTDFCAVYPEITNVNFYRGNGSSAALTPTGAGTGIWNIGPGYYTLKFNTLVDEEQQPLSSIDINWGDNQIDRITNQDHHPGTPHVVSHNYNYSTGVTPQNRAIKIRITDNWGYFRYFPTTASSTDF